MKRTNLTLIFFSLVFVLSGCYKAGCTDPEANNYDPDMKTEDLSCTYTGNIVFWAKPGVSDSLDDLGHVMLRFELEGKLVDSIATSGLVSTSGICNTGGTKTIVRNYTGDTERDYKYRVKGYGYETIYEGFVAVVANNCAAIQLK